MLAGMRETLQRFDDVTLIVAFNPTAPGTPARSPELLLEEISGLGLEIFMISDNLHQAFRVRGASDWRQLLGDASSANLFCVKRDRALSICMFAHSAGLGGAERSLVRFVEQLVSSYGAMCSVVVPSNGPLVKMLHHAGASCVISEYRWCCAGRRNTDVNENWANWIAKSLDRVLGEIAPLVGKINPDVVWTQTMVIPWGAMTAAVLGKPHVWSVTEFGKKITALSSSGRLNGSSLTSRPHQPSCSPAARALQTSFFPQPPRRKFACAIHPYRSRPWRRQKPNRRSFRVRAR